MDYEIYENVSSSTIERLFVKISCGGRISHGIEIWRKVGENDWHTNFRASYYTDDLRAAREVNSQFMKYFGKANLESKVVEFLLEFANRLKYSAKVLESEADRVIRKQKRKRCLAMAKWCADVRELMHKLPVTAVEADRRRMKACKWCRKWRNRWLELAEKFKEAK